MAKVEPKYQNRVITVVTDSVEKLDKWTSELLDIIDEYGGANPYPRFFVNGDDTFVKYYSCTTKIGIDNIVEFDKDIQKWRDKQAYDG
jgi:hypothetical protein